MATRHGTATVTLPSNTEMLITPAFDAPRSLVWDTLTTPRHLLRWWGPGWCPLVSAAIDLRPQRCHHVANPRAAQQPRQP
jgi:uncharacterized protein YndB with AHSA1/START domain